MIVNAFSGADGWGVGASRLGLRPVGFELDADACATARAAGHVVVRQDVTTLCLSHLRGEVEGLIGSPPCTDFSKAGRRKGLDGDTGRLIFEMPRLWGECRPTWIALEQVPEVLPYWRQFAAGLSRDGYGTWTGVLDAADYGDPQNRSRAILIASLLRDVGPPPPTHTEHPHPSLFGEELLPWVSMADALGWGMTDRPSYTITAGGTSTGGAEPFGHAARKLMERRIRTGQDSQLGGGRTKRYERTEDRPSPSVTSGAYSQWWHLDTHRDQREDGSTQTRDPEAPTPSVTAKASGQWAWERLATTVMGDQRVFPPDGHHPYQGLGSYSKRAIKVTLEELAALQSFPPGYPFVGNKSSVSRQIGNAIPSRLAEAVLSEASGTCAAASSVTYRWDA